MTTHATDTAFPVIEPNADGLGNDYAHFGVSKREYFAAKAMQGLCACPQSPHWSSAEIARYSIEQADALIAALNGETA